MSRNRTSQRVKGFKWRLEQHGGSYRLQFQDSDLPTPQILDLGRWEPMGPLLETFAKWFALDKKRMRRNSRYSGLGNITNGWVEFLVGECIELEHPSEITTGLVKRFIEYLGRKTTKSGGKLSIQSQMHYWSTLKGVLRQGLPEINANALVLELPFTPFGNQYRPMPEPAETNLDAYAAIIKASAEAALKIIDHIDPIRLAIQENAKKVTDKNREVYIADVLNPPIGKVALYFIQRYNGLLPERRWLKEQAPRDFALAERVGYSRLCTALHPQLWDLVPFVYLLAFQTGYNQAPLLSLKLSDYQLGDIMGQRRLLMSAYKVRANSQVRRSFKITGEKLSAPALLKFIESWTSHLRDGAPVSMRNDLFLYANKWKGGNSPYKTLATHDVRSSRELTNAMLRFCKKNRVPYLGLRAFRTNFSELFRQLRPDDAEGLRVLLGQQHIQTTQNNYRSKRSKAEAEEALGGAMLAHERMISQGGKVDLRCIPAHRERTAATPGFACLDPLDSPFSSETKGKLCAAYGRCPECHLAVASPDRSYALARFLQLKEAYRKARAQIGEVSFAYKYLASEAALEDKWLAFEYTLKEVEAAASLLLGDLPDLE